MLGCQVTYYCKGTIRWKYVKILEIIFRMIASYPGN